MAFDKREIETLENAVQTRGFAMASRTAATRVKRKNKHEKAGRRRKNRLAKKSTQKASELFASLGDPGKPAPKA